jgi:hypothetical protein
MAFDGGVRIALHGTLGDRVLATLGRRLARSRSPTRRNTYPAAVAFRVTA